MAGKTTPNSNNIMMASEVVRLDPNAMDMILRSHGVMMQHFRAIRCPLGVEDRFDIRAHGDHSNCSNGFIYRLAGEVTVFFSGNGSSTQLEDIGIMDGSTTQITIPRFYDNKDEEVAVQHYDRFFLKEIAATSVNTQLVEAHISGIDRLQYQAVEVEYVIDADGIEYGPDDYMLVDGKMKWTNPTRRPQFNAQTGRGTVYSIRYRYVPFWYVKNLIHEVRVARTYDHQLNQETLVRMPYAVQLTREYMFENEQRGTTNSDSRDVKAPRTGSFGPR